MKSFSLLLVAIFLACVVAQTPRPITPIVQVTLNTFTNNQCTGTNTPVVVSGACQASTGQGVSQNFIPFTNTIRYCTYPEADCGGTASCVDLAAYGCVAFNGGFVNVTYPIQSQQPNTNAATPVNINFVRYSDRNCVTQSTATDANITFSSNQCFAGPTLPVRGQTSFAYNYQIAQTVAACIYQEAGCSIFGTCQIISPGICSTDAGSGSFILRIGAAVATTSGTTAATSASTGATSASTGATSASTAATSASTAATSASTAATSASSAAATSVSSAAATSASTANSGTSTNSTGASTGVTGASGTNTGASGVNTGSTTSSASIIAPAVCFALALVCLLF